MSSWNSDSKPGNEDWHLTELLREWGLTLLKLDWTTDEVNAGLSYVRRATERGFSYGDALTEAWKLQKQGRLLPNEP